VHTHIDLLALAADTAPGTSVPVDFIRDGGPQRATVRVAADEDARARPTDVGGTDRLGFRLVPLPSYRCASLSGFAALR